MQHYELLAEDNLISAVHAESILKHRNLKIDVVRNGKEAVQKMKDCQYGIFLLNIERKWIVWRLQNKFD